MKIKVRKTCSALFLVNIIIFMYSVSTMPIASAASTSQQTAIVWVADVSGSMPQADKQRDWADAVSLGVDLAPANTQAAFVAVNTAVVTQTDLLDVSQADNRDTIKKQAQNVAEKGDTDFSVGISAALQILQSSGAQDKEIYLVGDSSESGFMYADDNYSHVTDTMNTLTSQLQSAGVKVHLLFLRSPASNQQFMTLWQDMADKTGGDMTTVSDPVSLSSTVASEYFKQYAYNKSTISGINTTSSVQNIPIPIPDLGLSGARIFMLFSGTTSGIQAEADSAQLPVTQTGSYLMINLAAPMPQTVTLTLPPGDSENTEIYLLADGQISLAAAAGSETAKNPATNQYAQETIVTLTPMAGSAALFQNAVSSGVNWTIAMTGPDGQTTDVSTAAFADGKFTYHFFPAAFGAYNFTFSATQDGISLSATTTGNIPKVPLKIPTDYILWAAVAIGALLILAAIIVAIALRRKKRAAVTATPVPVPLAAVPKTKPSYAFVGKLDIYGTTVEGGKAEIPSVSFKLSESKAKSVTLALIFQLAGVPYMYPAAAHISFSPGPDYSLVVRNQSDAVVYCAGQAYHRGQEAKIVYGQKIRVVFEEEVNEYVIYYQACLSAPSGRYDEAARYSISV